jgi:hypothetical protein
MDRKKWLTILYREANLFLEHYGEDGEIAPEDVEELEPELHAQLQEVLRTCDSLEDIIKHSLLRDPPPELWADAEEWQTVVTRVATACLLYDVQGIIRKIISGELPKAPSNTIELSD